MAKKTTAKVDKQKIQWDAKGVKYEQYRPDEKETAYEKFIKAKFEGKKVEQPKLQVEKNHGH